MSRVPLFADIRRFGLSGVFVCMGVIAACSFFVASSAAAREHAFRFASGNSGQLLALSTVSTEQDESDDDESDDDSDDEDLDDMDEDRDDQEMDDMDDTDDMDDENNEINDEDMDDQETGDMDDQDNETNDDDDDDDATTTAPTSLLSERTFFSASQLASSLVPGLDAEQNIVDLLADEDSGGSVTALASAVDSSLITEAPAFAVGLSQQASGLGQSATPEPSAWILALLGLLVVQLTRRLDGAR